MFLRLFNSKHSLQIPIYTNRDLIININVGARRVGDDCTQKRKQAFLYHIVIESLSWQGIDKKEQCRNETDVNNLFSSGNTLACSDACAN